MWLYMRCNNERKFVLPISLFLECLKVIGSLIHSNIVVLIIDGPIKSIEIWPNMCSWISKDSITFNLAL